MGVATPDTDELLPSDEISALLQNQISPDRIGDTRVSTDEHDLTAQRNEREPLGVDAGWTNVDFTLTGTHRARPGCHCGGRCR